MSPDTRLGRLGSVGMAALLGVSGLSSPVAATDKVDIPPPIVIPGEMPSLKAPDLIQTSSLELPATQEAVVPDFELFSRIIDASLNPDNLRPIIEKVHKDLSKNPEEHFGFGQELGGPGYTDLLVYTHPELELVITDPGDNENYLGQFYLTMQLHKEMHITVDGDSSGIVMPMLNLYTLDEQIAAFGFFNTPVELRLQGWEPWQADNQDGLLGVYRGYWDENNMQHAQYATADGLITHAGTYELSEPPAYYGSLSPIQTLINVQP